MCMYVYTDKHMYYLLTGDFPVSMFMYVCVYMCVCVYIYIHVYVYMHTYTHIISYTQNTPKYTHVEIYIPMLPVIFFLVFLLCCRSRQKMVVAVSHSAYVCV